jgi:hypothetical protein
LTFGSARSVFSRQHSSPVIVASMIRQEALRKAAVSTGYNTICIIMSGEPTALASITLCHFVFLYSLQSVLLSRLTFRVTVAACE